ncbi:MAG: DMT family transporter [Firmicutes bacterium]|jgi:drug/metabolite transporter (DMT)-like permease|nr:DMT family transporter [Bacillota bacterium]
MTERNKGILLMIAGSLFAAIMAALVKTTGDLPTAEKLFFRSAVGTVIMGGIVARSNEPFLGRNKKLLAARGILGFSGLALYFFSIERLPLGNAVLLNQVSPFFTIILALLFLQEKVSAKQWLATAIAITGVVLVSKPTAGYTLLPALAGLLSAIFSGASHVVIRELRKTDSPDMIVFYYTGMTSLVSLPFMLGSRFQAPTLPQLGGMLAAGVAATISQWLLSCAYRYSKAGDLSLYLYANTVFATLLGAIFWHEIPDFLSLAGIILVLTGACINTYSS